VAAVAGRHELDARIGRQHRVMIRVKWDQRVVLRSYHQDRDFDIRDEPQGGLRFVIMSGIPESETWRGDLVVDVPYGAAALKIGLHIAARAEQAIFHAPRKPVLIHTVAGRLDAAGTSGQVDGRVDADHSG